MMTNKEIAAAIEFREARDAYRKLHDATLNAMAERRANILAGMAMTTRQLDKAKSEVEQLPPILTALAAELRALDSIGKSSMIGLVAIVVEEEKEKASR